MSFVEKKKKLKKTQSSKHILSPLQPRTVDQKPVSDSPLRPRTVDQKPVSDHNQCMQFTIVKRTLISLTSTQIDDIHSRGKVAIIVGGTNYYIEALLWDTLMVRRKCLNQTMSMAQNRI